MDVPSILMSLLDIYHFSPVSIRTHSPQSSFEYNDGPGISGSSGVDGLSGFDGSSGFDGTSGFDGFSASLGNKRSQPTSVMANSKTDSAAIAETIALFIRNSFLRQLFWRLR
jgi:hypothetical protein